MPKNIRQTLKDQAQIHRSAATLITRMISEGSVNDPVILDCLNKMKQRADEMDALERYSNAQTIPSYELQRDFATLQLKNNLKLKYDDENRAKMDEFFANLDPKIIKTEEGKNLLQVYLKSSAVQYNTVTFWNSEMIELNRQFSKLLVKTPLEELKKIDESIVDTQNKIASLSENLRNNDAYKELMNAEKDYKELVSPESKNLNSLEAFDKLIAEKREIKKTCNAVIDVIREAMYAISVYGQEFNEKIKLARDGNVTAQSIVKNQMAPYNQMIDRIRTFIPKDLHDEFPFAESWEDIKTSDELTDVPTMMSLKMDVQVAKLKAEKDLFQKYLNARENLKNNADAKNAHTELMKEKQHLKDLKEAKPLLAEIGKSTRTLKDLITGEKGQNLIEGITIENVNCLFEMAQIHEGSHKNSKEFDNMMGALEYVVQWEMLSDPETREELIKKGAKNIPDTLKGALEQLKEATEIYKAAKIDQRRPFPSARRQWRLAVTDVILDFANEQLEMLNLGSLEKAAEIQVSNKPEVNVQEKVQEIPELNMPNIFG